MKNLDTKFRFFRLSSCNSVLGKRTYAL